MIRNAFFILIGLFGGLWLAWPGVTDTKGWECSKEMIFNTDKDSKDSQEFLGSLKRKFKLSTAISPKALLRAEDLSTMDKLRIVGDACFR